MQTKSNKIKNHLKYGLILAVLAATILPSITTSLGAGCNAQASTAGSNDNGQTTHQSSASSPSNNIGTIIQCATLSAPPAASARPAVTLKGHPDMMPVDNTTLAVESNGTVHLTPDIGEIRFLQEKGNFASEKEAAQWTTNQTQTIINGFKAFQGGPNLNTNFDRQASDRRFTFLNATSVLEGQPNQDKGNMTSVFTGQVWFSIQFNDTAIVPLYIAEYATANPHIAVNLEGWYLYSKAVMEKGNLDAIQVATQNALAKAEPVLDNAGMKVVEIKSINPRNWLYMESGNPKGQDLTQHVIVQIVAGPKNIFTGPRTLSAAGLI